jgi:hypothetical protein
MRRNIMTTASSDASSPKPRPKHLHHGQVSRAFKAGNGAYPARVVSHDGSTVVLERVPDGPAAAFAVALPDELEATLAREDVTRLQGSPLALVSPSYGVLGIATGPATPPARLNVTFVSRLEDGHAVEIPASDPEQPSLQLFAIRATEGAGAVSA